MLVAGVDEAGRGPLAGPVVAAAVVLDTKRSIAGLADSKVLTPARRQVLAQVIKQRALCWAVGRAEVADIDRLNILQASLLAMRRAVETLDIVPDLALIDGNRAPPLACRVKTVVKGDATIPAVQAASILAKVARDAEMFSLDKAFPGYGFSRHKGYPTATHLLALAIFGVSPVHRRTFGPVRRLLECSQSSNGLRDGAG
ncbi:MAG: ribonuclease HII [Acidiferrobacterales bacterium]